MPTPSLPRPPRLPPAPPSQVFEPPLFTRIKEGTGFLQYPGCSPDYECFCSADEHCAPEWKCLPSFALPQFKVRGVAGSNQAGGRGCEALIKQASGQCAP